MNALQMPSVRRAFEEPESTNALLALATMGRRGGQGLNALAMPGTPPGGEMGDSYPTHTAPSGDMAGRIRSGLIERGMPPHVADAFVLNFQDESGLDPGINEAAPIVPGSRGGFGLAQWTGPRRRGLEAYAAQRGAPASDVDVQLDYLMQELQGDERRAAQAIMAADNTGDAATAIVTRFLRPLEQHQRSRSARYARYR